MTKVRKACDRYQCHNSLFFQKRSNSYLLYFADSGFTLIELLVTIIILGVLSALALPSFLNQVDKAGATEGKSNTGAILRAQQVYRYSTGNFAADLNDLGIAVQQKNYAYVILGGITNTSVEMRATPTNNDFRIYAGAVLMNPDTSFDTIICESNNNRGASGTADVLMPGPACDGNSSQIQ